jgi:hypothetical protein
MPQATPAPTTGTCARARKREAEAHAHARVNLRRHAHTPWCHTSPPAPLPVAYTLGPRHSPARHSTPHCSAAGERAGVKLLRPLQGSVVPSQEPSAQQQDSHTRHAHTHKHTHRRMPKEHTPRKRKHTTIGSIPDATSVLFTQGCPIPFQHSLRHNCRQAPLLRDMNGKSTLPPPLPPFPLR